MEHRLRDAALDECKRTNDGLLLLSRLWASSVASESLTNEVNRFLVLVNDAIAVLLNAMDNGTYRFSFYFDVGFDNEEIFTGAQIERAFMIANLLENAINAREKEIAEGIAEEEEAFGRHDILTGRLLQCLFLSFYHIENAKKSRDRMEIPWEAGEIEERANFVRLPQMLFRYFWKHKFDESLFHRWDAEKRSDGDSGEAKAKLAGRLRAKKRARSEIRALCWHVFELATCKSGFAEEGMFIHGIQADEKFYHIWVDGLNDVMDIFRQNEIEDTSSYCLVESFCTSYIVEAVCSYAGRPAAMSRLKSFFACLLEVQRTTRSNGIHVWTLLGEFFAEIFSRITSRRFNSRLSYHEIVYSLLECKDAMETLARSAVTSCTLNKHDRGPLKLIHYCMIVCPLPFLAQPDFLLSVIDSGYFRDNQKKHCFYFGPETDGMGASYVTPFYSKFFREVVEEGKKSAICTIHRSGANHAMLAFLAILISQSSTFTYSERFKILESNFQRNHFRTHFKECLGTLIVDEVDSKLCQHVRHLAKCIRKDAKVLMALAAKKKAEEAVDEKSVIDGEQYEEKTDAVENYQWKLHELRIFLTAHALLGDFVKRPSTQLTEYKIQSGEAKQNNLEWPIKLKFSKDRTYPEIEEEFQRDHKVLWIEIGEKGGTVSHEKVLTHRNIVSWHSEKLARRLPSANEEAKSQSNECTIQMITKYPDSLRQLLVGLNERVISIDSPEKLREMLVLANKCEMVHVLAVLLDAFSTFPAFAPPTTTKENATIISNAKSDDAKTESSNALPPVPIPIEPSCLVTLENVASFLECSAKSKVKFNEKLFAGLCRQWWQFGPQKADDRDYERHRRNCAFLLESLSFLDDEVS